MIDRRCAHVGNCQCKRSGSEFVVTSIRQRCVPSKISLVSTMEGGDIASHMLRKRAGILPYETHLMNDAEMCLSS